MIGVSKKSKYIYSNKIASKRNIQSLSVDNLMGVDYSSSMLNIQDNHAYDIKNFLKKNGTLQKRPPVEQVGIKGLNGVWECNYNGQKYVIAHKDSNLYLVNNIDEYDNFANNYTLIEGTGTIENQKSWGVFTNDRLYILCGSYVVVKFVKNNGVVSLTHYNVYNDVDTYVPTTTIGITKLGENELSVNRTSLDNINLMTNYVKNSLYVVYDPTQNPGTPSTQKFELDNFVLRSDNLKIKVTFKYYTLDSENKKVWHSDTDVTKFYKQTEETDTEGNVTIKYTAYAQSNYSYGSNQEIQILFLNIHVFEKYNSQGKLIEIKGGNIAEIGIQGKAHFLDANYDNQDNIIIEYPIAMYKTNKNDNTIETVKNESHLIEQCTFGVMYGAGGNRNRLFVSGNPNKPNVDYHTSRRNIYASDTDVDLLDSQDLTYFSVYDYCAYGTSNTAITDYQIMGDGSLMVLKEESPHEPNIYFRDSNYETKTIALGDVETQVVEETYPMRVGNIGEGAIRGFKDTLHNLNNDLVFLSDNGVFGISSTVSAGMLNSDYKYSYGRSRLINSKLKEDLLGAKNIATIVYDHKYFLTIKKKDDTYITYVGDGRYPYKIKDSIDNEYEYEWFVLDGINADKYHIINGILFYSNNNGLHKFDLFKKITAYKDLKNIPVWLGDIYFDYNNDEWATSQYINLEEIRKSDNNYLYVSLSNGTIVFEKQAKISNGIITVIDEQMKEYLRNSDEYVWVIASVPSNIKVSFKEVEDEENKYYCYDENGNLLNTDKTSLEIHCELNGHKFKMIIDDSNELVGLQDYYGYLIKFRTMQNIEGTITIETKIPCYFLTKSYNFGQSVYSKYLKSMTMINDSEQLSYTNFGIITKEVKKRFEDNSFSGTNGLVDTYENIFKADLTTGRFSTSFTKDYLLKFNFVQFEFYNNDDTNCIINNFTILYTTGFKTKGVS